MKKLKILLSVLALSIFAFSSVSAQETSVAKDKKLRLMQNWGIFWAQVTRLQLNTERSNFVWRDDMVGLFYSMQTANLPINFIAKVSAYYPYHIEFNKVTQISKQVIVYAIDFNAGPIWTVPLWNFARLDFAPVINFRYQMDDYFNHLDLGVGAIAGFEFPFTKTFSVLLNGEFTYDYGNLGSNKISRQYDQVWSYGAQLGFRFAKKCPNDFYYFAKKSK